MRRSEGPPDPGAEFSPREALRSLQRLVRTRRRGSESIWDLLYRAYVTVLLSLFGFYLALGIIDDSSIGDSEVQWVRDHGAGWIGLLAALAFAAGIRSGQSGGPLTIDEVDLHHLVMSPIDRSTLLSPMVRRLVASATLVGGFVGGASGELASRRLPGEPLAWIGTGALVGMTLTVTSVAVALVAASLPVLRRRPWVATVATLGIVGWAVLDIAQDWRSAPTTVVGSMAIWPLTFTWWAVAAPVVVAALTEVGRRRIVSLSIERTSRRAHLVKQVRFALAQQDIRSLILLRRQLAFERPRRTPLLRLGNGPFEDRVPAIYRDARSYLRWPIQRIVRVVALAAVTGVAFAGVWQGTTALALGAAALTYLTSLEVVEPFAQELDHPTLLGAAPIPGSNVLVMHLASATVLMSVLWAVSTGVAVAMTQSTELLGVLALGALPAAAAAVTGGAISTKRIGAGSGATSLLLPEEVAGPQALLRLAWPIVLAGLGSVPIVLARHAVDRDDPTFSTALPMIAFVAALAIAMFAWIRFRDEIDLDPTAAKERANG